MGYLMTVSQLQRICSVNEIWGRFVINNKKRYGRKWSLPISKCYLEILLERTRKITKTRIRNSRSLSWNSVEFDRCANPTDSHKNYTNNLSVETCNERLFKTSGNKCHTRNMHFGPQTWIGNRIKIEYGVTHHRLLTIGTCGTVDCTASK